MGVVAVGEWVGGCAVVAGSSPALTAPVADVGLGAGVAAASSHIAGACAVALESDAGGSMLFAPVASFRFGHPSPDSVAFIDGE